MLNEVKSAFGGVDVRGKMLSKAKSASGGDDGKRKMEDG